MIMAVPYKIQRKRNPQKPDEPGQWHAVPKTGSPVKEKFMTRMAIYNQSIQGKRVRIPGLGSFRVSFGSEGVDDIMDFHTGLIRNVKIVFTLDSDLRASILNDISFENAGVDDEGVQYASLENYKQVKGLSGDNTLGSGTPGTGGGSDDGNDDGEL